MLPIEKIDRPRFRKFSPIEKRIRIANLIAFSKVVGAKSRFYSETNNFKNQNEKFEFNDPKVFTSILLK